MMRPIVNKHPVKQDKVEQYKKGIEKTVTGIDSYFLQDRKFFLGDYISIADLQAMVEIEQVLASGYDPLASYKSLQDWRERVRETTSPHYQEATKILYQMTTRMQQLLDKEHPSDNVHNTKNKQAQWLLLVINTLQQYYYKNHCKFDSKTM